jgi:putative oxidoreductase
MLNNCFEKPRHLLHKTATALDWLPGLLTRIVVGWIFVEAGWGKFHKLDQVIGYFTQIGIPFPQLQAPFVATMELGCGFLLLIGLAARVVSIPLIIIMFVAIETAKRAELHSISDLFSLNDFLFLLLLVWILIKGAGCISADYFLKQKCEHKH